MSTRHILTGERITPSGQQVRKKVKASRTIQGFRMKPGYLYTVVRAISARVNQNYDGWPSSELKTAYHTFLGKPVFVNHENFDPDKARGVVVASRYIENGNDKYIEVVQEIDAKRFPLLAHEIKTGGLDSVSMGAEAGFTICSACGNKAYDEPDMCDHVKYHKGETLRVHNRKTGRVEDKLVYESCHKLSFFELSYVFDPADETAVASKVVMASAEENSERLAAAGQCGPGDNSCARTTPDPRGLPPTAFPSSGAAAGGAAGAAAGATPQVDTSGVPGQGGSGELGTPDADGVLPSSRGLYDTIKTYNPDIGTYRVDDFHEHDHGALDVMTSDPQIADRVKSDAFAAGSPYVLWNQTQWNSDGTSSPMDDRGSPTDNHMDHVHTAPITSKVAMVRQAVLNRLAGPSDDYLEWAKKVDEGEEVPEKGPKQLMPNKGLQDWAERSRKRMAGDFAYPPTENSQKTQVRNTGGTYSKAHAHFDAAGAPQGKILDYGAGLGHSSEYGDTFEPHPRPGFDPTHNDSSAIPDGSYHRVTNLNVLNVVPPEVRDHIVGEIGRVMAPGGHAVITTRGRDVMDAKGTPGPEPMSMVVGQGPNARYQKGFTRNELHQYVQNRLGPDYSVSKVPLGPAGVHIVRNAAKTAALESEHPLDDGTEVKPGASSQELVDARLDKIRKRVEKGTSTYTRSSPNPNRNKQALRSLVRTAALNKLGWGETEAPQAVDTLREEGTAPEDDNDDFHHYVESPDELSTPDLSQAGQLDREQENGGQPPMEGQPGPAEGGAPEDDGNFMVLKIPIPGAQQGAPGAPAPPQIPMQTFGSRVAALQTLAYFERYYGRKIADWQDAIEAGRSFTAEEEADFVREATLLTLENSVSDSTTSRNTVKGTANMARSTLATRRKTAGTRHYAEGPLTDGGDVSRNDQGEQEEAFITETPSPDSTDLPDDDKSNISNTEDNLVADAEYARSLTSRMNQQKKALEATAREYARVAGRRRTADEYAGGPESEKVDPELPTESANQLAGDDFDSANPNPARETQPGGDTGTTLPTHESSLAAFQAFDKWLRSSTKKGAREHSEHNIKRAAKQFADYNGIQVQAMFPALGIALRQARKNEAAKKGKNMRKRAVDLETAAPDERVSVPTPVADTTDAEAQASQFDEGDFGNNAGDNLADPDLGTGQNWAPGQAPERRESKKADGILSIRCAEAMIAAGLEPNTRERKYQLAAEFSRMSRGLIMDRTALAEKFAMVRQADRHHYSKVASGSTRGTTQSPIPAGLGQGGTPRQVQSNRRTAANDPTNDALLFG